jgi:hypothetical protein
MGSGRATRNRGRVVRVARGRGDGRELGRTSSESECDSNWAVAGECAGGRLIEAGSDCVVQTNVSNCKAQRQRASSESKNAASLLLYTQRQA